MAIEPDATALGFSEQSDIWLLEIFGCNIMFVEGKFESAKCQDWRIRAMHKPSILRRNQCCATQKLAIGSLSVLKQVQGKPVPEA